jgi:hypothetical protein
MVGMLKVGTWVPFPLSSGRIFDLIDALKNVTQVETGFEIPLTRIPQHNLPPNSWPVHALIGTGVLVHQTWPSKEYVIKRGRCERCSV